jgi:hypothetical protein
VYKFLFTIARTKPSKTPKVEKIDEAQEQEATGESESKNEATNKDDTDDKADIYWWRKPEDNEKPPTCRKSLTNFIT